jgi:nitrite reductase (NADH) large subunit
MSRHVSSYEDEWRATLENPDRLARFVSFVNAPGTPDPTIRFGPEREQIRPADPEAPGAPAQTFVAGPSLEVRTLV